MAMATKMNTVSMPASISPNWGEAAYVPCAAAEEAEPVIANLRENPPKEILLKVESVKDFLPEEKVNVIKYNLEGGNTLVVRPSGTEPKIKVYALVKADSDEAAAELAEKLAEAGKALL